MEIKKGAAGEYESLEIELRSQNTEAVDQVPYLDLTEQLTATLFVKFPDGTTIKQFELDIVEQAEVAGGSKLRLRYVPEATDFPAVTPLRAYVLIELDSGGSRQSKPFPINVVGRF